MSNFINQLREGRLTSINIDSVLEYDVVSRMYIPLIEWCVDASYITSDGYVNSIDWDINSFSEYTELIMYIMEQGKLYSFEKTFGVLKLGEQ